jgi:hypothetical protein
MSNNMATGLAVGLATGIAISSSAERKQVRELLRYDCERDYQPNSCDQVCLIRQTLSYDKHSFLHGTKTYHTTNVCTGDVSKPWKDDVIRGDTVLGLIVGVLLLVIIGYKLFSWSH